MVARTVERERRSSGAACQHRQLSIGREAHCDGGKIAALDGAVGHLWLADKSSNGHCFLVGHISVVEERLSYR